MMLELSIDDVLSTTRTVRKRLDLTRPVPRAVVDECARLAFQAPNGSNEQRWGWVFVDDAPTRRAMAELYREKEMAELLGIPAGEWTQAGLFPVAYTVGTDFKPGDRTASDSRIFWNRWQA